MTVKDAPMKLTGFCVVRRTERNDCHNFREIDRGELPFALYRDGIAVALFRFRWMADHARRALQ